MTSQIHTLTNTHIGPNTRIWQFVVILPNARLSADYNICYHVLTENDVIISNRVRVKYGVQLRDSLRIADDVLIGPNVTFTNDPFLRSKQYTSSLAVTTVKASASIGADGENPSMYYDRQLRNGGRQCGGDEVGAGQHRCRWQPGSRHSNPRRQR